MLIQKEPGDRRAIWITSIQECDIDIKRDKLVKRWGLCKLDSESLDPHYDEEGWENKEEMLEKEVPYMPASNYSWYNDLKYYLTHGSSPGHLDAQKR